jgi:hypothetical protein
MPSPGGPTFCPPTKGRPPSSACRRNVAGYVYVAELFKIKQASWIMSFKAQSCDRSLTRASMLFAIGVALSVAVIGCGPKQVADPNRTTISGTVTFNGKPLPGGAITFESKEKHINTTISLRAEGRYTTDRVPLGPVQVSIETESLKFGSPHLHVAIPAKYADTATSGLTVDVKEGINENVNFKLKP